MLSTRIRKFHNLMRQANDQSTDWLIGAVRNPGAFQSKLSTLACLRVIMARTTGAHLVYRDRMMECKRAVLGQSVNV